MLTGNSLTLRDFARSLRARKRSPRTIKNYLEAAGQLAAYHGDRDLAELGRGDVEAYIVDVLTRHTASTAATRYRGLQQLYNWAVEEELCAVSPMAKMHPPALPEQVTPIVPIEDLRALLRACEGKGFRERRDTAILRLFLEPGGLRLSELAGVALADLDLDRDVVIVTGKGNRVRVVPFGAKTGTALTRYLRVRATHEQAALPALWLGNRGVPMTPSGVAQMLERRAQQAGIGHVHPHQLRHTAAHEWKKAGGSDDDAMRLFGWRSREMLARYGAALADDRAQESARRLGLGDRI